MSIAEKLVAAQRDGEPAISFEFFPAQTEEGRTNLLQRVQELGVRLQPAFVTLTWRAELKNEEEWLRIGTIIQRDFGIDVLMHVTCHLPADDIRRILSRLREAGIRNILALRGDTLEGQNKWKPAEGGFTYAHELVSLIREEHGDFFCIGVAGYPEVHTECWNSSDLPPSVQARERDLDRLKNKVEAGADFVLTQFVYHPPLFLDFVERCHAKDITVPIVPGYMPVQSYGSFHRFSEWCKTYVPPEIRCQLEAVRDDDAAVKAVGVSLAVDACRELRKGGVNCVHLFTMNMADAVTAILERLDAVPKRQLPWAATGRESEEVRPIFWAHRQMSYVSRTTDWVEFPNGRWGDSRSPAYGELGAYYLAHKRPTKDRRHLWGVPRTVADVAQVFIGYLQGTISELPWCEEPLSIESSPIANDLCWLNESGFLTINSQPRVNCVPSTDPDLGWGGAGGFVFQKAYVEFFCSEASLDKLRALFPTFPNLVYHAMAADGREETNAPVADPCDTRQEGGGRDRGKMRGRLAREGGGYVNAVTWGVFPGREIVQPTIVDAASFGVWKDEAFELWLSRWAASYDPEREEEKASIDLIRSLHDSYYLVNVVDNDFISPDADIFTIFRTAIANGMDESELRERVSELEADRAALSGQVVRLRQLQTEAAKELEKSQTELARARLEADEAKAQLRRLQVAAATTEALQSPLASTRRLSRSSSRLGGRQ